MASEKSGNFQPDREALGEECVVNTLLYHWSPVGRREAIEREGLVPGSWSTDGAWKPPYLCFANSPSLAWELSPMMPRGQLIPRWDLWMTWSRMITRYEVVLFDPDDTDPTAIKEVRVFETVPNEKLWFVGTRRLQTENDDREAET